MNYLEIKPPVFSRLLFVLGLIIFFIYLATTKDSSMPNVILILQLCFVAVISSVTGYGVIVLIANIKIGRDFKGILKEIKTNLENAIK